MASIISGQVMACLVSCRTRAAAFRALSFFGGASDAFVARAFGALVAFWGVAAEVLPVFFLVVIAGRLWVRGCPAACPLRCLLGLWSENKRSLWGGVWPGPASGAPASLRVGGSRGTFLLGLFFADMSCLR